MWYEEPEQPVSLKEFLGTMTLITLVSFAFSWVFIYALPYLMTLVIR